MGSLLAVVEAGQLRDMEDVKAWGRGGYRLLPCREVSSLLSRGLIGPAAVHRTANHRELVEPTANRRELPLAGRAASCSRAGRSPACRRGMHPRVLLHAGARHPTRTSALAIAVTGGPGGCFEGADVAAPGQLPRIIRCRIPHGQSSLVPCAKVVQSRGRPVRDAHGARG
jgi:hypothetical protein